MREIMVKKAFAHVNGNLPISCLIGVIILGLMTIIGSSGGGDSHDPGAIPYERDSADVTFATGNVRYEGYLSQPAKSGSYPVVLILHGSEGYKDHHKTYADSLAEQGYVVLAACWFGCGSRDSMADVECMDFTNMLQYAAGQTNADPNKQGIVGFSAGAAMTLYLGASLADLSAIVAYYGIDRVPVEAVNVVADNGGAVFIDLSQISAPVLIIQGTADAVASMNQVQAMVDQFNDLGKTHETKYYSNATHAFNWPDGTGAPGTVYDEGAADDALQSTFDFLDRYLK